MHLTLLPKFAIMNVEVKKMAQSDEQFPVLFENSVLRVHRYYTNEIFIEDKQSGAEMRIGLCQSGEGLQFTTSSMVEPIRITNMIGWRVGPRWLYTTQSSATATES